MSGKYDKEFLDYVYKIAEQFIKINPINSKSYKIISKIYNDYVWYVWFNKPLQKKKNPYGKSILDLIEDKKKIKELLLNIKLNK